MSSIKLESNASGTGIFTIASPNSNTNRTLTLPDSTGTVMTTATAIAVSQFPAGSVLQVVSTYDASTSSSSATYADVFAADLSITLSSTSNKIYLMVTSPYSSGSNSGGTADVGAVMNIVRTTSGSDVQIVESRIRAQSLNDFNAPLVLSYMDSSFSVVTQTYNVQFKRYGGNDAASTQYTQFIAMEIKA